MRYKTGETAVNADKFFEIRFGGMAELVDAPDLSSGAVRRPGSSPGSSTNTEIRESQEPVKVDRFIVNTDRNAQRLNRCLCTLV